MMDALTTAASLFVLLVAFAVRPRGATCPEHWWLPKGIQPSGHFVCRPTPIGDTVRDKRGIIHDESVQPPGELEGHIYCEPNAIPTIVDTRAVACRSIP